jgi:hypothetical protein
MGVAWIPVLVLYSSSEKVDTAMHYLFAVLNAFSGVWLFYLHCVKDEQLRAIISKRWKTIGSSHKKLNLTPRMYKGTTGTGGTGKAATVVTRSNDSGSNGNTTTNGDTTFRNVPVSCCFCWQRQCDEFDRCK